MPISAIASMLACPTCGAGLAAVPSGTPRALACRSGHSFDIARQGHVNLLGRAAPHHADTAAMVAARARFLGAGHYRPIEEAVARRVGPARRIVEAGAGTGHYLARVLDTHPGAVGLAADISPHACRRSARAHPRMGAVVADTWAGLPVRDGAAEALLCIFAPRNVADFCRILAPGGALVVVTPQETHLAQAREALGLLGVQEDKLARLNRSMVGHVEPVSSERLRWRMELDAVALADLVEMGPNAFHEHAAVREAMAVDADVTVSLFRKPLR